MRITLVKTLCAAAYFLGISSVFAAPAIPIAPGTSWRYNMTEEIGKGLNVPNVKADADGKIRLPVLYRLDGTEDVDGKNLLKFEMHRAGAITNTDLLSVDDERGGERFEHTLSLVPRFTGLRFYTFPGGCVTYRFAFAPGASPILAGAAGSALSFQPRSALVHYVQRTEGLTLCGRGAACPG